MKLHLYCPTCHLGVAFVNWGNFTLVIDGTHYIHLNVMYHGALRGTIWWRVQTVVSRFWVLLPHVLSVAGLHGAETHHFGQECCNRYPTCSQPASFNSSFLLVVWRKNLPAVFVTNPRPSTRTDEDFVATWDDTRNTRVTRFVTVVVERLTTRTIPLYDLNSFIILNEFYTRTLYVWGAW